MPTATKPTVRINWSPTTGAHGFRVLFPEVGTKYFSCIWFEHTPEGVAAAIEAWKLAGPKGLSDRDKAGYPTRVEVLC